MFKGNPTVDEGSWLETVSWNLKGVSRALNARVGWWHMSDFVLSWEAFIKKTSFSVLIGARKCWRFWHQSMGCADLLLFTGHSTESLAWQRLSDSPQCYLEGFAYIAECGIRPCLAGTWWREQHSGLDWYWSHNPSSFLSPSEAVVVHHSEQECYVLLTSFTCWIFG